MDSLPPDATPVFQAAVLSLLDAGGLLRDDLGAVQAVWFDASHVTFVYDVAGCVREALLESIARVWTLQGVEIVDVALAGGDRALFEAAHASRPTYTGQRTLGLLRIDERGDIEVDNTSKRVAELLRATFRDGVPARRSVAEELALIDEARRRGRAQAEELDAFQQRIATRSAAVTRALLVVIAALFATKWALGEHGIATDVRMGALVPGRVASAPWMLVSHAFLHGNAQHILFNGLTLFSLGTFYEGLLGRWRFAVLFALAAIGGGLAASFAGPMHVVVGASGALWGMLGVSFALALRPGAMLPAAMLPSFRRNAVSNLVLQVLVSMIPNVSWQAHLGGGVVGFALMLTGVLRPRDDDRDDRMWTIAGLSALALCAAGVIAALATGRPWTLRDPPTLTRYALPGTTVTVALPGAPTREGPATRFEFASGDPLLDGFGLGVQATTVSDAMPTDQLASAAEEVRVSLGSLAHPPSATATGALRVVTIGGFPALTQSFTMPDEMVFEHRLALRPTATVSVQLARRRADTRAADLADRIAASVETR